jgi:isopentenyl phosphate kinase
VEDLFLVLKIGGSLFSDKSKDRHIDHNAVSKFARLIAELAHQAPGRMVLIIGGGSYGHGAVRNIDFSMPLPELELTEANFIQRWIWTLALRNERVPAMPFLLSTMCAFQENKLIVSGDALRMAIASKILPVLSGDCLVVSDGTLRILGSDRVPQILFGIVPAPIRVVAFTDISGIISAEDSAQVIRDIDPNNMRAVMELLWAAPESDTTDAMKGKLEAFAELANKGAECFIMHGDSHPLIVKFLFDPVKNWPKDVKYTRIARLAK